MEFMTKGRKQKIIQIAHPTVLGIEDIMNMVESWIIVVIVGASWIPTIANSSPVGMNSMVITATKPAILPSRGTGLSAIANAALVTTTVCIITVIANPII